MTKKKPQSKMQAQFSLEEAKVQLTHKNDRLEKHGDVDVLAVDLDFKYETSNAVLAFFHPQLRASLYARKDDAQGEVIPADPEHLTVLRVPALQGPFKLDTKLEDCELRFHKGNKASGAVVFADAKVEKFAIDCRDGGTVIVSFQAKVQPDETQAGKLSGFLQDKHCILTLIPSEEVGGQAPLDA